MILLSKSKKDIGMFCYNAFGLQASSMLIFSITWSYVFHALLKGHYHM